MDIRRVRLSIDITEEQQQELTDLLPFGFRTKLFRFLIDDLIALLRRNRAEVITNILMRDTKAENILQIGDQKDGND